MPRTAGFQKRFRPVLFSGLLSYLYGLRAKTNEPHLKIHQPFFTENKKTGKMKDGMINTIRT